MTDEEIEIFWRERVHNAENLQILIDISGRTQAELEPITGHYDFKLARPCNSSGYRVGLQGRGRAETIDYDRVIELYKQGKSKSKIALLCGCCLTTVYKVLYKNGFEATSNAGRPNKITDSDREKIVELRHQGFSYDKIAKLFNVSRKTIIRNYRKAIRQGVID